MKSRGEREERGKDQITLCQEVPNAGVLASFRSVRAD